MTTIKHRHLFMVRERRRFHLVKLSRGKFHLVALVHHWVMIIPVLSLTLHLPSPKMLQYCELKNGIKIHIWYLHVCAHYHDHYEILIRSYEEYVIVYKLSLHRYFNIKDARNNIYYVYPCTTPFWTETMSAIIPYTGNSINLGICSACCIIIDDKPRIWAIPYESVHSL